MPIVNAPISMLASPEIHPRYVAHTIYRFRNFASTPRRSLGSASASAGIELDVTKDFGGAGLAEISQAALLRDVARSNARTANAAIVRSRGWDDRVAPSPWERYVVGPPALRLSS